MNRGFRTAFWMAVAISAGLLAWGGETMHARLAAGQGSLHAAARADDDASPDESVAPPPANPPVPRPNAGLPPFTQWGVKEFTIDALGRIGMPAARALAESLHDRDPQLRRAAAQALARMGADAKESVPDLIEAIHDREPSVRLAAIRALGQIGPEAAKSVPALIEVLQEVNRAAADDT